MRHLVYLLVVANVVYLGWNLFQGRAADDQWSALPPLPDGARPLVTLQEHGSEQTSSLDATGLNTLTAIQPPGAVSRPDCQALGPFSLLAEAKAVAGRLGSSGLEPVQRTTRSRVENGFWVFLPAKERENSREIVQQLKERNDEDYYVGKDWLISLGTFRDIKRAKLRLAEVQKYGLDAILEPRYKTRQVHWLELPASGAAPELAAIRAENPRLELHSLSCL